MESHKQLQAICLKCVKQQKELFAPVSFQVTTGEMLLIEGSNGSGKSSLLRLLAGLATPFAGNILWQTKLIQTIREDYANSLHYIGHTNGIKLGLTVQENLQLTHHLSGHAIKKLDQYESLFSDLHLTPYLSTQAKYLSAGQKRRLALAKLFLIKRPLWILDEPLTALDIITQNFFFAQLSLHLQSGGIAIISSHQAFPSRVVMKNLRLTSW